MLINIANLTFEKNAIKSLTKAYIDQSKANAK